MWNERYATPEHVYGTEPNAFLASSACRIPPRGRALCLMEGEGRNAVFLAGLGHAVTAMDGSEVGLAKARALAEQRGVSLQTVHADAADFMIEPGAWDGIVSIYGHLPPPLAERIHRAAAAGLRPGGVLVLEAYSKSQLGKATGGPKDPAMLYDLETLRSQLAGLRFEVAREVEREVHEGRHHTGVGSVIQILAVREA